MTHQAEMATLREIAGEFINELNRESLPALRLISKDQEGEDWGWLIKSSESEAFLSKREDFRRRMISHVADKADRGTDFRRQLALLAERQRKEGFPLPMYEEFEYLAIQCMRLL